MLVTVEADLTRLRMVLGETEMATKDFKIQMFWLKEELSFLKKSHEEVRTPLVLFLFQMFIVLSLCVTIHKTILLILPSYANNHFLSVFNSCSSVHRSCK